MREVRVVVCPFDSARPEVGMGAGPRALLADERVRGALERDGRRVRVTEVPGGDASRPEIARTFEQHRWVAEQVHAATQQDAFPLVLAGNCGSSIGTVAGVGAADLGIVWLDAHADLDTPEDNRSGFLDVMALTTIIGGAWQTLAATVEGFAPVPAERVVLAGVRDLEDHQRAALARSAVAQVPGAFTLGELEAALEALGTDRALLHLDLDALDAAEGRANAYAADGGPTLETLSAVVDAVFDRFDVAAVALTAYDPAADRDDRARAAAATLLERVLARV
jgi:arginase